MNIAKELLSEKNYAGSRLIEIDNKKITELNGKLSDLQKEINPVLEKLSKKYYPAVDPLYKEVQELTKKANEIRDKIQQITNSFKEDTDKIENAEQRATLIKNKLQPLIQKEIEGKLSEFEIARHTTVIDKKIFVEVFDEIEEKIKQIRANKAKK